VPPLLDELDEPELELDELDEPDELEVLDDVDELVELDGLLVLVELDEIAPEGAAPPPPQALSATAMMALMIS
jgi:hypothetical protein